MRLTLLTLAYLDLLVVVSIGFRFGYIDPNVFEYFLLGNGLVSGAFSWEGFVIHNFRQFALYGLVAIVSITLAAKEMLT